MYKLSPSLLAADFSKIGAQLKELEDAKVPYLHLDIMDGLFVPNLSIGLTVVESIRKCSNMIFDVHLMIVEPERYVAQFAKAGADIFCFHIEATSNPEALIQDIKAHGMKPAITLKPKTSLEDIKSFLKDVDMALVMTVEPGFGGQAFMEEQLEKVRELVNLRKEYGLSYDIEVDGGINPSTLRKCLEVGANVIVAGSAVFAAEDLKKRVDEFSKIALDYPNI